MQTEDYAMSRTMQAPPSSAVLTVSQLLSKRAEILGWLERLDQARDGETQRVVDRIRTDYQQRLHDVVRELTEHVASLRSELDSARERHQHADSRFLEAEDALHEARLRHRIGEIPADVWESRRGDLERAVEAALSERTEAEKDVQRLEDVLSQVETGARPDAVELGMERPGTPADPAGGDTRGQSDEAAIELDAPVPPRGRPRVDFAADEEADVADLEPGELEQDFAFLEKLDRAIAFSAPPTDAFAEVDELEEETRVQKGSKCPECGYTNDVEAWYCGVCGVDLA